MAKPHINKTLGPIHFEDLEPHRFEDLVRELVYDYKDWQTIEATGRSGSDDGFDIRAYEKVTQEEAAAADEDEEREPPHPMEGHLWMIQVKREKGLGPAAVSEILDDVDPERPPYGYILAVAANVSKKVYDTFRDELRKKGVFEFYLWSKAEIEDMLHLPKNDRILFTFFGVSLVSRRRSRTSEVRSVVTIKNKLLRALGGEDHPNRAILLRDLSDVHYPYAWQYSDFAKHPHWRKYEVFQFHPLGLLVHEHEYFAYVNSEANEWDLTENVDLVHEQTYDEEDQRHFEEQRRVRRFWELLPRRHQAHFIMDCLIPFSDIALVDDKGDVAFKCPHVFMEFEGNFPLSRCLRKFKIQEQVIEFDDKLKRVRQFPKTFAESNIGRILDEKIVINAETLKELRNTGRPTVLFDVDRKYEYLIAKDVVPVDDPNGNLFIQVTHRFRTTPREYEGLSMMAPRGSRWLMQRQLGREILDDEAVEVLEIKVIYDFEVQSTKEKIE